MTFADKMRHIRDPKSRMQAVCGYCKGKMVCESDERKEDANGMENDSEEPKKGHGGCRAAQPQIRK